MVGISKTWWGNKFIEALECLMDEGRLKRGRSYRGPNRILSFDLDENKVTATVRGNINPYFGVYKAPKYKVVIEIKPISQQKWSKIIKRISVHAGWMSKLLLGQMPDDIEDAFINFEKNFKGNCEGGLKGKVKEDNFKKDFKENFLPGAKKDLITNCSCPDWSNPCKHVAGVYFRLAEMLDYDPFLMFQLRGISKSKLKNLLGETKLGKALVSKLSLPEEVGLVISETCYPMPKACGIEKEPNKKGLNCSLHEYWNGKVMLDNRNEANVEDYNKLSATLIKKQGDFPPFWDRDNSFILAMEEIYNYIRKKYK